MRYLTSERRLGSCFPGQYRISENNWLPYSESMYQVKDEAHLERCYDNMPIGQACHLVRGVMIGKPK
jgi:hypothetical protein